MNIQSVLVIILIIIAVIFAVIVYRKNGSSCSCGGGKCDGNCSNCASMCRKNNSDSKRK